MIDENGLTQFGESGGGYSPVPFEDPSEELASPEDVIAFQDRFMRLLERRTAIYTMGDSSSVPNHVAVDLVRSICFVLGIDSDEPTLPQELLSVDLEIEFGRRLVEIEHKVELTGKLWQEACVSTPMIPNIALQDTLSSIGDFPKRYDYRSMAHEIPCSIDYPLCHPVSESLAGVDYVNEYLRRLIVEGDFLRRFELQSCVRVLASSCLDYDGLLINLYEPVAANAIGLGLVGEGPHRLEVSDADRAEIVRRLSALGHAARGRVLREAAIGVCDSLGICAEPAREYFAHYVEDLLPRIEIGLARQELRGVFL